MLDWIMSAFEDPSDRARFVAIVISAIVALCVVVINHLLSLRRELNKSKVEKIEEAYVKILKLECILYDIILFDQIKPVEGGRLERFKFINNEIDGLANEINMIFRLYFPKLNIKEYDPVSYRDNRVIYDVIMGEEIELDSLRDEIRLLLHESLANKQECESYMRNLGFS